jgi:hypothetical protein
MACAPTVAGRGVTPPVVLAFDLGLQTTGFAWPGGSDIHECPASLRRSPMTAERQELRRAWWLATFRMLVLPFPGCTIAVEDAITGKANGQIETHMLHGVLRGVAADNGSQVVAVHPSTLKKWATGDGSFRTTKEDMIAAAVARGCSPQTHDEADAYLLWCMVSGGAL